MASTHSPNSPQGLPLLDIEVLRTFVAIAETGSFTRAAQQVFRTPSAVSMQIKRLEEMLGRALFVREPRQVHLTPEGETMLGYARQLLELNDEAVGQFLSPQVGGTVRLGAPDDLGTRVLPGVLSQFSRNYPAVQVNVRVGRSPDLMRRLDIGELDVVLMIAEAGQRPHARAEAIYREPLVWAGREGGVALQRTPLPLAVADRGCAWRQMALSSLNRSGLRYRIAYTCEHTGAQEAAVLQDIAITPFPRSLVKSPIRMIEEEEGGLSALGDYEVLLLRMPARGAAVEALVQHIIDHFAGQTTAAAAAPAESTA
ncbi:LysR family transcriptional regulator [Spiribacter salinus M19-40]|jgi:DNA-binding transcriptional LysR family regulator|uniref:LysR family transcriptional regulator n=1 Tax=Spiribacter salinus M19-40 TaxID=1260251 RepID=R4VGC0_9GAMM|nr:LysR substrate-binding domain-containing protein [Spiribacter salinus]AGM41236.1 LysR family transcriptional regulator [Spiribacter salinus M19-40]MBY5268477.1 LysR family transcriptional regulator [Spiribacter salinus]